MQSGKIASTPCYYLVFYHLLTIIRKFASNSLKITDHSYECVRSQHRPQSTRITIVAQRAMFVGIQTSDFMFETLTSTLLTLADQTKQHNFVNQCKTSFRTGEFCFDLWLLTYSKLKRTECI